MKFSIPHFILRITGWKITGEYPDKYKKLILVAAPHTSWLDFFVGITVRAALNREIKFVGKHTLFWWPLGWLMRKMGGIPVNRSKSSNFVQAVVDLYNKKDTLSIVIAPEGTRKKVEKFRTGFYYIAKKANIPILLVKFNYPLKEVHFGPIFFTTNDAEQDLTDIQNEFKGIMGKVTDKSFHSN